MSMGKGYSIFWLHASSQSRFEQGLNEIARVLFSPNAKYLQQRSMNWYNKVETYGHPSQDILPVLRDWFCGDSSGKWLWIIDNADDEDVFFKEFVPSVQLPATSARRWICDYLPRKAGCRILYTSRNRVCAQRLTSRSLHSKIIQIAPLALTDAVKVVENGLRNSLTEEQLASSKPFTERLVRVLDLLPLALVQATSLMRENNQDPEAYLELYDELEHEQSKLLEEEFVDWRRDSGMPNSVLLTWKLSFEQLKARDDNAARLLCLMSILDRQCIPEWLLEFVPGLSRFSRFKALGNLRSFSFITQREGKVWEMHRLVQIATRAWIEPAEWKNTVQAGLRLLCDAFMGYLCEIDDEQTRINKSLEYYPHTKNVLAALATVPDAKEVEAMTLDDFFTSFSIHEGKTLNSATFPALARKMYEEIAKGDYNSVDKLATFVNSVSEGSFTRFRYLGLRPKVSRLFGEDTDFY
jgi:hypothetical protein